MDSAADKPRNFQRRDRPVGVSGARRLENRCERRGPNVRERVPSGRVRFAEIWGLYRRREARDLQGRQNHCHGASQVSACVKNLCPIGSYSKKIITRILPQIHLRETGKGWGHHNGVSGHFFRRYSTDFSSTGSQGCPDRWQGHDRFWHRYRFEVRKATKFN